MECNKRAGNVSEEQKRAMLEFMTIHPELRKGKFSQDFTYKKGQTLWEELTQQLNQLNGGKKDWKSWRKTWQDQCSRAKQKQSAIHNHRKQTGGGAECSQQLSTFEETLTSLLGQVPVEGHPNTEESLVINFLNENEENGVGVRNINEVNNSLVEVNTEENFPLNENSVIPSYNTSSDSTNSDHCYASANCKVITENLPSTI